MGFTRWKKYGVYRQEKVYSLYVSLKNPTKLLLLLLFGHIVKTNNTK
jgi:hypothetical protein